MHLAFNVLKIPVLPVLDKHTKSATTLHWFNSFSLCDHSFNRTPYDAVVKKNFLT